MRGHLTIVAADEGVGQTNTHMSNDQLSPSRVIRDAREREGIDEHSVAEAAGLNDNWYLDVESYGEEVTSNISLAQLGIIARMLRLSPFEILEQTPQPPMQHRSLSDLVIRARQLIDETGESIDAFSERVGWEMAPVFANPRRMQQYTFDALADLCAVLSLDWRELLVDAVARAG